MGRSACCLSSGSSWCAICPSLSLMKSLLQFTTVTLCVEVVFDHDASRHAVHSGVFACQSGLAKALACFSGAQSLVDGGNGQMETSVQLAAEFAGALTHGAVTAVHIKR